MSKEDEAYQIGLPHQKLLQQSQRPFWNSDMAKNFWL